MSVRESVVMWFKRHLPIPEDGHSEVEEAERERQDVREELDELERQQQLAQTESEQSLQRVRDILTGSKTDEPLTLDDLRKLLTHEYPEEEDRND